MLPGNSFETKLLLAPEAEAKLLTGNTVESKLLPAPKVGKLAGSLKGLTQAERTMVNDLLSQGRNVEIIPRLNMPGVKTPDFKVDGVRTELKTLGGTSLNTPVTRIQEGFGQGAQTVIIDGRASGLTADQAITIIDDRIKGIYKGEIPGKIEIWTSEGTVFGGK